MAMGDILLIDDFCGESGVCQADRLRNRTLMLFVISSAYLDSGTLWRASQQCQAHVVLEAAPIMPVPGIQAFPEPRHDF